MRSTLSILLAIWLTLFSTLSAANICCEIAVPTPETVSSQQLLAQDAQAEMPPCHQATGEDVVASTTSSSCDCPLALCQLTSGNVSSTATALSQPQHANEPFMTTATVVGGFPTHTWRPPSI